MGGEVLQGLHPVMGPVGEGAAEEEVVVGAEGGMGVVEEGGKGGGSRVESTRLGGVLRTMRAELVVLWLEGVEVGVEVSAVGLSLCSPTPPPPPPGMCNTRCMFQMELSRPFWAGVGRS